MGNLIIPFRGAPPCGLERCGRTSIAPDGTTSTPVHCRRKDCSYGPEGVDGNVKGKIIVQDEGGHRIIGENRNPAVQDAASAQADKTIEGSKCR